MELEGIVRNLSEEIVDVIVVGITGRDGLPVAIYAKENFEVALVSAEIASICDGIETSIRNLNLGNVSEFYTLTDKYGIFGVPIKYDCYLFAVLRQPLNLGKIRILFKKYVPKIEEMMK